MQTIMIPNSMSVWTAILITAIFATAFMCVIQNEYQKYISSIKAAIIYSFEPFFGAIIAFFYLSESFSGTFTIGGLLIFLGMLITEYKPKKVK